MADEDREELVRQLADAAREILAGETVKSLAKLVSRKRCTEAIESTHPTVNKVVTSGEQLVTLAADRVFNDDDWGGYDEAKAALLLAFQEVLFDAEGSADVLPASRGSFSPSFRADASCGSSSVSRN